MKRAIVVLGLVALFLLPIRSQAADFRGSNEDTFTVPATEQASNLYLYGNSLTVNSNVKGDLAIAGHSVLVNGNVENSLFAVAASTISVRGTIGQHARLVGQDVTISGKVNGDLFVAADTLTIDKDASVSGSLYAAVNNLVINGVVAGEVKARAQTITINNAVGSMVAYGNVTLTDKAVVNGDLRYHFTQTASIDKAAKVTGKIAFSKENNAKIIFHGFTNVFFLLLLLGSILLGWLLIYLLPQRGKAIVEQANTRTITSIAYGLLLLVAGPILFGLLLVSVVGIPLSILVFLLWALLLLVGSTIGKILLGAYVYRWFTKKPELEFSIWTVIIGTIIALVLAIIPIIGGLVVFIFYLLGAGALAVVLASALKPRAVQG